MTQRTHTDQLVEQFLASGEVTKPLALALADPASRLSIYRAIASRPLPPFRSLLLHLLEDEISHRDALSNGDVDDEEEFIESIYHCAFLLSECADPADTLAIWKAHRMNQDIGELAVGYFVGAGVVETLSYLDRSADPVSQSIAEYIRESLNYPGILEDLGPWAQRRRESIAS